MAPKLVICLLTYARTEYAIKTLRSALDNIVYDGPISVHIADDGSSEEHRNALYYLAGGYSKVQGISISNSERGGYGKNFNLAMQTYHQFADVVLPLEDDWELVRPLEIEPMIRALHASVGIECIRLGYLSFTQALYGRVMSVPPEWYKYLLLNPSSPEPHVFAGHPRLETVAYEIKVGPWMEGLLPGQTEFEVTHRPSAREGVAWPMDFVTPSGNLFAHIGAVRSTEVAA